MTITQATKTQVQQWVKRKEQQSPSRYKISSFKTWAVTWALEQDSVGYLIAALNLPSKQSLAFRCQNRKQTSSKQLIDLLKNDRANNNTRQEIEQFINRLTQDQKCHTLTRLSHESQPNELIGHHITITSQKSSGEGWQAETLDLKKLAQKYDTQDRVEQLLNGTVIAGTTTPQDARPSLASTGILNPLHADSAHAAPANAGHNSAPPPSRS